VILLLSIVANVEHGLELIQRVFFDNDDDVVVTDSKKSTIQTARKLVEDESTKNGGKDTSTAIPMKEMFTLTIGSESQVANNKSNSINSLLFLSSLKNKIPRWVKILFRILFVTILVLKLLGISILSVFIFILLIDAYF